VAPLKRDLVSSVHQPPTRFHAYKSVAPLKLIVHHQATLLPPVSTLTKAWPH